MTITYFIFKKVFLKNFFICFWVQDKDYSGLMLITGNSILFLEGIHTPLKNFLTQLSLYLLLYGF